MTAFSFAVIFFISCILTSCKSYPATFEIAKYIEKSDKSIEYVEGNDFFIIRPVEEKLKTDIGMIFYPGGRVNYQAYLPLMEQFAKRALEPSIVCESNGTQAEDAAEMKKYYEGLKK